MLISEMNEGCKKMMRWGGVILGCLILGLKVGAVTSLATVDFGGGALNAGQEVDGNYFRVTNVDSVLDGAGAKIVVGIPSDLTVGSWESGDVVFTISGANAANLTGGNVSWDVVKNEVSYVLDADDEVAIDDLVQVYFLENGDALVTAPNVNGQFGFSIRMVLADETVSKMGVAILEVGNEVEVSLEVAEVLVLSVNQNSVSINADSQVNSGVGTGSTILNVASNVFDGFVIKVNLEGTGGVADALVGATTGRNFSASAESGDDYFWFDAADDGVFLSGGTGVSEVIFSGSTSVYSSANAGGALVNTGSVVVNYEMNVSENTRGDTYEGTVVFTIYPAF